MMQIKTWNSRLKEVSPFNLHGTVAVPCGTSVSSLNADNQRTQATLPDGSAWSYSYDTKSQLTGAVRGTENAMSYAYDGIGNRLTAEEDGAGTVCTANNLNQYTAINAEAPAYDADGNMTSWNGWNYTWNTENRLVAAEKGSIRFEADYDFMGRRFEKKIYESGVLTRHEKYAYDGYKLVAIFDALDGDALRTTFAWQPVDLDTPLTMTHNGETFYYVTDGNKNVIQLLRADKTEAAAYTYAPFGGVLEQQGALANVNPFRFSSEFHDDETGLVYYNYRYYNPVLGRWTKRDLVDNASSINVYAFINNSIENHFDLYGLWSEDIHFDATKRWALQSGYSDVSANIIARFDEKVDSVMEGDCSWAPIIGNQGYHFNRGNSGEDSRLKYKKDHIEQAKYYCDKKNEGKQYWDANGFLHYFPNNPELAAKNLGIALHPLQDWVAHGDYAIYDEGGVWTKHNNYSPQANLEDFAGKDKWRYPDNPLLDAVNGIDGRAAGMAMHTILVNVGMSLRLYAIYQLGTKRLALTRRLTVETLVDYRKWLKKNGTCECQQFFGVL